MQTLNKIEGADIKRLGPTDLVRLLDTLLQAEARRLCIGAGGIHVPYEINVPDGGSDGEWRCDATVEHFIPASFTRYQVKATGLSPSESANELIVPDGSRLKPQVEQVLSDGGAYVFFCSHPSVMRQIQDRINEAKDKLREKGHADWGSRIYFLDGNQIATWANQHVAAYAFVCKCLRISNDRAFRGYQHWLDYLRINYAFQLNGRLSSYIRQVRSTLAVEGSSVRITGLSGLGKTRLAFEVFNRDMDCPDQEDAKFVSALAEAVVYCDYEVGKERLVAIIDEMSEHGYRGIVVVDNCPQQVHRSLSRAIQSSGSRLSLLTMHYDPEPVGGGSPQVVLTPGDLRDVVPKILEAIPGLSDRLGEAGIRRVADFAQGFPQIAILVAEAGQALDLHALNREGEIANRLIWGSTAPDLEALNLLRCLSLFTQIGAEGGYASQLEFVLEDFCGRIDLHTFNLKVRPFKERGILQEVGDFLMVTPAPLAVALAAQWIEALPIDRFDGLLERIESHGLAESFCGRLRQLDFSERARALSERLMEVGGPLSSAEVLNSEMGSQVFRALSEVNPSAAADCLERVFHHWTPGEIRAVTAGRRELVWALEKLVFRSETFPKAARTLRLFAAGESEGWSNNATGQFKQLFHIHLSGTQTPAMERLCIIREGLQSEHPEVVAVCLEALGAAMESRFFSRSSGAEFSGTRTPGQEWQPARYGEIYEYWREAFHLLTSIALAESGHSDRALELIGARLNTILDCPLADDLEAAFKAVADSRASFWPTARDTIKTTLRLDKALSDEDRARLERWLSYVTPASLETRLTDIVSVPSWEHDEIEPGEMVDRAQQRAVELAEEFYREGVSWKEHLPRLLAGDQRQAFWFGHQCAQLDTDPGDLFRQGLELFMQINPKERNLQLLRGIMDGICDDALKTDLLDRIASDVDACEALLVPLTSVALRSISDLRRVTQKIQDGILPPDSLRSLGIGRITRSVDDAAFLRELEEVVRVVPETAPSALYLIMYHTDASPVERWTPFRRFLESLVVHEEVMKGIGEPQSEYVWKTQCMMLLTRNPSSAFVERLARAIVAFVVSAELGHRPVSAFREVLPRLFREHPETAWLPFAEALRAADGHGKYRLVTTLARGGGHFDASGSPLWSLPIGVFRSWLEANRDLIPLVIHFIPLFQVERSSSSTGQSGAEEIAALLDEQTPCDGERYVWHPFTLALLEIGAQSEIYGCLHANMCSFGSSGSRVPYIEKRIRLVDDLRQTENATLIRIADSLIADLKREKAEEEKMARQRAAGIYEPRRR